MVYNRTLYLHFDDHQPKTEKLAALTDIILQA